MTTDEKILEILERQGKTLENLQAGQERIDKTQQEHTAALVRLDQGQHKTLLKVMEAGINDIRENMARKADAQDIKAEQGKLKRRIENLEEHTKTPNPHKN